MNFKSMINLLTRPGNLAVYRYSGLVLHHAMKVVTAEDGSKSDLFLGRYHVGTTLTKIPNNDKKYLLHVWLERYVVKPNTLVILRGRDFTIAYLDGVIFANDVAVTCYEVETDFIGELRNKIVLMTMTETPEIIEAMASTNLEFSFKHVNFNINDVFATGNDVKVYVSHHRLSGTHYVDGQLHAYSVIEGLGTNMLGRYVSDGKFIIITDKITLSETKQSKLDKIFESDTTIRNILFHLPDGRLFAYSTNSRNPMAFSEKLIDPPICLPGVHQIEL